MKCPDRQNCQNAWWGTKQRKKVDCHTCTAQRVQSTVQSVTQCHTECHTVPHSAKWHTKCPTCASTRPWWTPAGLGQLVNGAERNFNSTKDYNHKTNTWIEHWVGAWHIKESLHCSWFRLRFVGSEVHFALWWTHIMKRFKVIFRDSKRRNMWQTQTILVTRSVRAYAALCQRLLRQEILWLLNYRL